MSSNPKLKEANNQLEYLDLSNCKLTITNAKIFNDLKRLKYLDLSKISLEQVLPDLFKELKQLETLKLVETNYIPLLPPSDTTECYSISPEMLTYASNLKELHVSLKLYQPRLTIDKKPFNNHPNLESLNITTIEPYIPDRIFKIFKLPEQEFTFNIDVNTFSNLKSLTMPDRTCDEKLIFCCHLCMIPAKQWSSTRTTTSSMRVWIVKRSISSTF